jgi:DNA polymerase-3 subunit delta
MAAELRSDPARLADEAASMSLFGEARYVLVEPAG